MNEYGEGPPVYRTIRVTAQSGPIAAFADEEAWRARERYPRIVAMGLPTFLPARESEQGGWRILGPGAETPQGVRDTLASHFRQGAAEAEREGRGGDRKKYLAAAERLDRSVIDDMKVLGSRYRVVRVEQFLRLGLDGPEPPRPSDPDPGRAGDGADMPSRVTGFVIDPHTGTGMSEGLLKLDLAQFVRKAGHAPPDIYEDALRARVTHPGAVLLPAEFAIAEKGEGGHWKPHSGSSVSPQGARDGLAFHFRVVTSVLEKLTEQERDEYVRAADRLDEKRGAGIAVGRRRFRVARVEQLVRIGPEGPEGPRPSDYDPDPPIEVEATRPRAEGEPSGESGDARELKKLLDVEAARRLKVRESKG